MRRTYKRYGGAKRAKSKSPKRSKSKSPKRSKSKSPKRSSPCSAISPFHDFLGNHRALASQFGLNTSAPSFHPRKLNPSKLNPKAKVFVTKYKIVGGGKSKRRRTRRN